MIGPRRVAAKPSPPITASAARVAGQLLDWYDGHRRALPWRALPGDRADPYAVWLSEVMLQQTTVAAVKPYYATFLLRWPTVQTLARAPVEEVMKAWSGLGYYRRARNLHACAQAVTTLYGGRFPRSEEALRALPGIGRYTAAAIMAIAFGRRAVVVDGNVERVVARLFAIDQVLPKAKVAIAVHADRLTPSERPGDFAQAIMDLGAKICTPRRPACTLCPCAPACRARAASAQESYPRKRPQAKRPSRIGDAFYVRRTDGWVLVRTRPVQGLLGGMTEFPGTEWVPGLSGGKSLSDSQGSIENGPVWSGFALDRVPGHVDHVFTHFSLRLAVFAGAADAHASAPPGCRWVAEQQLEREALPTLMRKVARHARNIT